MYIHVCLTKLILSIVYVYVPYEKVYVEKDVNVFENVVILSDISNKKTLFAKV